MSATGATAVITGGVTLFVGFGSPVGDPALATFVNVPLAGALTVNVTLLAWPLASVPTLHVTAPLLLTPPPDALTKAAPAGNVSVTSTPLAVDGPKFVTEIV
jgi:hypothetical protein